LIYQGYLCNVASQWLYSDIDLPLAGMDELIQTITASKPGYDRSIFGILRVGVEVWKW